MQMNPIGGINRDYLTTLKERMKKSRVYTPNQSTGLLLTEILQDKEHKSLYMRIAKIYDNTQLIRLAKDLAERKNVDNRGAYFMRMLKEVERTDEPARPKTKSAYKTKA